MNRIMSFAVFCISSLLVNVSWAEITRPIDDSYTVSERYYRYKLQDPSIEWAVLAPKTGQRIQFDERYRQVNGKELHIDIFYPLLDQQRATKPAIMLIHGGGWRSGNKSHFYPMANLLAQQGYVVLVPEYRLSIEAPYPAGLEDINHAIVWAKQNAEKLGFNPRYLSISGGSSGGHMAALIGNTANQQWYKNGIEQQDTRVFSVVDLDGVLDFTTPKALAAENRKGAKSAAALWFGGAYQTHPQQWQQASTARHIHPQSPPLLIISSGQLRFTAGREKAQKTLTELGISNQYFQFSNIIHTFWLFEPYLSQTVSMMDSFIQQQEDQ